MAARQNNTNRQAPVLKGADVNTRSKGNGATSLMIAAGHGNQKAAELLLRLGARKHLKDDAGKTASD